MEQPLYNGEPWQNSSKCGRLTPEQADALFFVGTGGKVKRATIFCSTCPVQNICLTQAIEGRVKGFWSGTTEIDRLAMTPFHLTGMLSIEDSLPPEPVRRRKVYRKVFTSDDAHKYLDEIEPTEEELQALEQAS